MVQIVAAIQEYDNGIGFNNKTLVWIKKDMFRFKKLTTFEPNHPVIMGRKTYDSFEPPYRPLPNRTNIPITRNTGLTFPEGVIVVGSLEAAIVAAKKVSENISIIGGGEIYKQALDMNIVDRLELTIIQGQYKSDTYFPASWRAFGKVTNTVEHYDEENNVKYRFETRERV
ncbi:MAG TPA: dihydrofolate reductase [Candidatus Paceibacterota bacterium]|nr:dihydrofolate reductase [Candidatus Paceibacterota bacterium]